jgi:putative oxidoreductase
MKKLIEFVFSRNNTQSTDIGLLFLRLSIGTIMAVSHGWGKLANYSTMASSFADPIGLGITTSLLLTIFAELFCSIALILGLATRAAVVPLIITMIVAVIVVHGNDPWMKQEFGMIYLISYCTLLLTGPGRYSIDSILFGAQRPPSTAANVNSPVGNSR